MDAKKFINSHPSVQNAGCLTLAAQYLRMSKRTQAGSVQNQMEAIQQYARSHGFDIIHTYCDDGKSGLDLAHRPGLRQLLHDVVTGRATFSAVLVLDVSRWGRFQDPDEGAHYEFLCKLAGVRVHYCAECFAGEDGPKTLLLKSLRRVAAAEYVQELSRRTFAGQCTAARNGCSTGAPAGYGLRRLHLDSNGNHKGILADGVLKSLTTDRVKHVAGPPREVRVVRKIYSMFLEEGLGYTAIARRLNQWRIARPGYGPWDNFAVRRILTHPKYKGCAVFNRASQKLRFKKHRNPIEQWIIQPNGMDPVVPAEQFQQVQEKLGRRFVRRTDVELLNELRGLCHMHGRLSLKLITEAPGLASWETYRRRFGSMQRAYELIGYFESSRRNLL
jgi:DNA invertase Pin-like site-specific DNA recombinase